VAVQRTVSLLSGHVLCAQALSELLESKGWRVSVCASAAQLSASARKSVAVVIDLDHCEDDSATVIATARALTRVIPVGTALRQAAAIDTLDDVGIETRNLAPGTFAKLLDNRRASPELARHFKQWQRITPRQRSVMRLLASGHDNRTIAKTMSVGERAIKAHVSALLSLFGLDNRTELALLAFGAGLRP
jgi:DNA-binding NarL/FixJ family response regulator